MSVPHSETPHATLEKLYQAASELLCEYGYDYLTMRNVCEKAGVSYGSLYYFFGSKEELICQYCTKLLRETVENNPLPQSQDENDFVSCILWYYFLYMSFLERMGPRVTQALYSGVERDLFDEVFREKYIAKLVQRAASNNYLRLESPALMKVEIISLLQSDLNTLLAGTVMNWVRFGTDAQNAPPRIRLARVMRRFLSDWETDSYREKYAGSAESFQRVFINPSSYDALKLPDYVRV